MKTDRINIMMRNIPRKYIKLYNKAMSGRSRKAAIRSFCLECVGYSPVEVENCTDNYCPLYGFRVLISPVTTGDKRNVKGYSRWRNGIIKRDGYKCCKCGSTKDLQVHHIIPVSDDETKVCDNQNATTLCIICHSKHHYV